jgi:hypothetical protein
VVFRVKIERYSIFEMTGNFQLDFPALIQVLVEKMGFIQQALEKVVNNQVGLSDKLPETIANRGSLGFHGLKMALNLIIYHFFKTHLKNDQTIKFYSKVEGYFNDCMACRNRRILN